MKYLFIIPVVTGCYSEPASDPRSERPQPATTGERVTSYCHDQMELTKYLRQGDGGVGKTDKTSTIDVKVVVSEKNATVMVGAKDTEDIYHCVKYLDIPLVKMDKVPGIDNSEGHTDRGFSVMAEDEGWRGRPTLIGWSKTNQSGRNKFGADLLRVNIGRGLYTNAHGESIFSVVSSCQSPSEATDNERDCVEFSYQDSGNGKYSWKEVAQ